MSGVGPPLPSSGLIHRQTQSLLGHHAARPPFPNASGWFLSNVKSVSQPDARDEDGDGFHEVHGNTIEGFWSLLRSWLRPHRGISQEKPPLYLGFFEFVHNARKRGKALLGALLETVVVQGKCQGLVFSDFVSELGSSSLLCLPTFPMVGNRWG